MNQNEKLDFLIGEIQYIKSLLEDNPKTNQKGAINRISDLENTVSNIETKDRVRVGKAGVIGGFVTGGLIFLGKVLLKII